MDLGILLGKDIEAALDNLGGGTRIRGESVRDYDRIISSRIARMEIHPLRKGPFYCYASSTQLGELQFTRIMSDPVEIRRSRSCIERDGQNQYLVGLNLTGSIEVSHCHWSNVVRADHLFLLDKAVPYHARVLDQAERIMVVIPRRLLEGRLSDPSRHLRDIPTAASGIGKLASQHIQFLAREGHSLSKSHQLQAMDMCLDLICLAFSGGHEKDIVTLGERATAGPVLSRVKAHLKRLIDDPELTPAAAAVKCGVSKRYLHKLFANSGTTFGSWVREERLMRARALLTDPRQAHLPVTEIAMRQGFNDIPHFCRLFKARFGETPTQARSGAAHTSLPPLPRCG